MKFLSKILVLLLLLPALASAQDTDALVKYIRNKSDIRYGGVAIFNYGGTDYVIAVSAVQVETAKGRKTEAQCRTVGSTKAKREMLSYIQGSNVSSYTELIFSEDVTDGPTGRTVNATQTYVEVIKETVTGSINSVTPLAGWYSEDGSLYYFALSKLIQ